ncbi:Sulphatase-modifying factor protein [[Leptolyngbya] sp. PCC 7376]|uniref:formylglycine-generating enzyme family protein n=1 Tax=[Leptolyngbya] sp. PCC 7376 TaxID=111781 RepID=UPI00029F3E0F|nr:formylglycine-generating enzyme family protein [[Leptolyngbya] sp. PCC 7376]AFY39965.1 Sulphatase-modifying factor protein [[Leptolyngbya] sp. PCC 7376]
MPRIILRQRPQTAQYFTEDLDGVDLDMMQIPAGTFVMGSPETEEDRDDDEGPQHMVRVSEFCLGRYPITQAQWRVVAGWEQVEQTLEPEPSNFKGEDLLPVEQVSWLDAKEFCARLNQRTKGKNYRFPSEAEWEYACRATTKMPPNPPVGDGGVIQIWNQKYHKPFSFGKTLTSEIANYRANYTYGRGIEGEYRQKTTPVGSFPANDFGLSDMHGNVGEWCEDDWHGDYKNAPTDGSVWLDETDDEDTPKVIRGGDWYSNPRYCRSACRINYSRVFRDFDIGFRVACSFPGIP